MKSIKRTMAVIILCLPLSAWGDFEITDLFTHLPIDSFAYRDAVVGEQLCELIELANSGTVDIEAVSSTLRGDFEVFRVPPRMTTFPSSWDIEICWTPTHPGRHVKNLTIDGWRANADGTIDALSITIRLEGRATKP